MLEEDGWADEARGIFREREGRRALVDGNARSCGQDGLVAVATLLGLKASRSKDAVRARVVWEAGAAACACRVVLALPGRRQGRGRQCVALRASVRARAGGDESVLSCVVT